ncbi:glycosyltransferase [bacterium]|nr:glycosyltransferase [bacterium]
MICSADVRTSNDHFIKDVHVYDVPGYDSRFRSGVDSSSKVQLSNTKAPLRWIYHNTLIRLIWPDYAWLWYIRGLAKAKELVAEDYPDILITSSHPFTPHIIGFQIKKRYPKLKWLVDIGDPFAVLDHVHINNDFLYSALNKYWEKKVLKTADWVSVTVQGIKDIYIEWNTKLSEKIYLMPPISKARPDYSTVYEPIQSGKLSFVFVGTLYKELRSPKAALEFFDLFNRIQTDYKAEIHFIGNPKDCVELIKQYQNKIGGIYLHGQVSSEKANEWVKSADVLINVGNRTTYQVPSKVVVYLSAQKPILNFCCIENDTSADVFTDWPMALSIKPKDNYEEKIKEFIKILQTQANYTQKDLKKKIAPYQLSKVSNSYLKCIQGNQ